jgi:NMD protein affecting ribosome stability and mRNA decay
MRLPALNPGFHAIRRDQLRPEREHDSYKRMKKPPEPSFCPDCGAIFHNGRWQWGLRKEDAIEIRCPACLRVRDNFPSGFLYVNGPFLGVHRQEILGLIQHHADKARAEHPLARIITIEHPEGEDDGMIITTTDIHLARDLGEALHHAYHGELEFHYNEAEKLLRVHWSR